MFSQTVEYALRAAVWLGYQPDQPLTTQQLAQATQVPAGYLSKVLQSLGRAGLVRSQRGVHGGFTLACDPQELTVLAVVNAVDPIERIRHCPLGLKAHADRLCPLHERLDGVLAQIEEVFGQTTIAELLAEPGREAPLCDVTVEGEPAGKTGR